MSSKDPKIYGTAFKLYDPELPDNERSDYWEKKMQAIYFTHPEFYLRAVSNSLLYSFINHFLPKEGLFFDGGCGSNYLAKIFDTTSRKIVGLDFAVNNLALGKKIYPEGMSVAGDLNFLPFKDTSFDGVLSVSTAEHLETGPSKLFMETHRVLKRGGIFLLLMPTYNIEDLVVNLFKKGNALSEIPHSDKMRFYKTVKTLQNEDQKGFFAYWFNRRTIKRMIKDNGFRIDKSYSLEVMGGLVRSRIFGRFVKPYVQKMALQLLKNTTYEKDNWTTNIFLKEDIFQSKAAVCLHEMVGRLYRYLFAFVCHKI